MSSGVTRPSTLGGTISVANSAALAAMDVTGLPVGSVVWNIDVGAAFKLTASERTEITIGDTDGYDSPQWTFADAVFTGFEDCTLLVSLAPPNEAFGGTYTIDTVDDPTIVTVTPAPDGATTAPIVGGVTLFDDALATDSVVAVSGAIGVRWIIADAGADAITSLTTDVVAAGPGAAAATIQAGVVTNAKLATMATHTVKGNVTGGTAAPTDLSQTQLTAEINTATNTLKGAMPYPSLAGDKRTSAVLLTTNDATISPGTDNCSRYVMAAGTLTRNVVITFDVTNSSNNDGVDIVILDTSAFTVSILNAAAGLVFLKGASAAARVYRIYMNAGDWIANEKFWCGV